MDTSRRSTALGRGARTMASLSVAMSCLAAIGCSGPKDFDNENDDLRRDREALQERVVALEAELAEANAKVAEFSRVYEAAGGETGAAVVASLPRCAGIEIDKYSGASDRDDTPGREVIDVYIRPYDGRRRFVQVAGRLDIDAWVVGGAPEGGLGGTVAVEDGVLVGRVSMGPEQLREAYCTGMTGTHYSASLVVNKDVRDMKGSLVLRAVLLDAVTGQRHETWHVVPGGFE